MKTTNRQQLIALFIMSLLTFSDTITAQVTFLNTTQPKREVRAAWLTTLEGLDWPRFYSTDPYSEERQKRELTDMLDKLKAANMNTVLLQTRIRATVIYPSAIEPWDACLTGVHGKAPTYDPLAFAVEECHKRGMEVQAWVVAIPVGKWNSKGCATLRDKHPDMVVKRGEYGYLDPANPATARYIAEICAEITRRYDIDGIHLDYIRYPETWDGKQTGKRRKHAAGTPLTMRQANITGIVRLVNNYIKAVKPWVKLSCATIGKHSDLPRQSSNGWNALVAGCQEAQKWMDMGIVDQIYPMLYFRGNNFYPFVTDWSENSHGRTVVAGLGAYLMSRSEANWPASEMERQMQVSRNLGLGYAFFRTNHFNNNEKGIYRFTKENFNPYPALVPAMSGTNANAPSTPTGLNVKRSNGLTLVKWNADKQLAMGGTLFNVYASKTYPVDTNDPSNLLAVRLTESGITLKDESPLYFAVTSMNRFGDESKAAQQQDPRKTITTNKLIENDGKTMITPKTDADCLLFATLQGTFKAARPYSSKANIADMPEGCYIVYSLDKKGLTHRLGFLFIKR